MRSLRVLCDFCGKILTAKDVRSYAKDAKKENRQNGNLNEFLEVPLGQIGFAGIMRGRMYGGARLYEKENKDTNSAMKNKKSKSKQEMSAQGIYDGIVKRYKKNFQDNLRQIGNLFAGGDKNFLRVLEGVPNSFGGPSIHFHEEAIKKSEGNDFLHDPHLEMIYAVLPAWGMHRMTQTTRIVKFTTFKEVILKQRCQIDKFHGELLKTRENMSDKKIADIIELTKSLKGVKELPPQGKKNEDKDGTYLVASSKTLHHILPNFVPPFDRAYSLKIMRCNHSKPSEFHKSLTFYSSEHEECYYRLFLEEMREFIFEKDKNGNQTRYEEMCKLVQSRSKDDFNTSLPKIFDNLIIAYVKFMQE